jgi:AcrR family transcriptional regulator
MATQRSLRERKKARTRRALVEAAMALFAAQGFEATTVEEIAAGAFVSRRTFFRYFPTKEAVAFPDREARLARFRWLLGQRRPGETAVGAVRRACLELARDYVEDRDELRQQQRIVDASPSLIAYEREIDGAWESAIAEALGAGADDAADAAHCEAARRARIMAAAVMGVIRAVLRTWFAGGAKADLVRLGGEALDLLEDGFAGGDGEKGDMETGESANAGR